VTLVLHILAGAAGLVAGGIALYSAKGARLHRGSGTFFVYAVLVLTITGTAIATLQGVAPGVNVPAALLTAYLVITARLTVRPIAAGAQTVLALGMLVVLIVGGTCLAFGIEAVAGGGSRKGILALLAVPVVAVPLTMFYWLWRVRVRRTLRGMALASAPDAA